MDEIYLKFLELLNEQEVNLSHFHKAYLLSKMEHRLNGLNRFSGFYQLKSVQSVQSVFYCDVLISEFVMEIQKPRVA